MKDAAEQQHEEVLSRTRTLIEQAERRTLHSAASQRSAEASIRQTAERIQESRRMLASCPPHRDGRDAQDAVVRADGMATLATSAAGE
jgi:hypothetical protein